MSNMPTQWNRQLNRHMLKVIESLKENIRKQIDFKIPSKQMNRLQNIGTEIRKYKAVR